MSSTPNPATITFEQMMALFLEDREQIRELRLAQKETSRQIAKLGDRMGELVSAMVEGGIKRMFKKVGYTFDTCNTKYVFGNVELNTYGEVDLFLENGEVALLVEVKTNLSITHIKKHIKRLEKFRVVANGRGDKRHFLAAVGGGLVQEDVRKFALKKGMFVVQQSGENIEIIEPKGKPKVW